MVVTHSSAWLPWRRRVDTYTHAYKRTLLAPSSHQRQGCQPHPAHLQDAAATRLPRNHPQPLAGSRHPTCLPRDPVPVSVLPPSVLVPDAACSGGLGKQVLGRGHRGPLIPVVGVAGEAGVPGSPSPPSLGPQSLGPWPDPAHRHRASLTLSTGLQQWPPGVERRSQGRAAPHPPTLTEPSATPIPSLSLFPPLNPLHRSSQGKLSPSCAFQLPSMGREQAGIGCGCSPWP